MRRDTAFKLILLVAGVLFALLAAEVFLRLAVDRYEYAAKSEYSPDALRLWVRVAGSVDERVHPDTGVAHAVIHNNLGLHQHRDITTTPAAGELRVGLFGDSYAENLRLPAQYAVTEVLDFLLNRFVDVATVLNFGVDGYGTDQSYLTYRDEPAAQQLDYVIYLLCSNDLQNIYTNRIYDLTADGELRLSPPPPTPWAVRALSRLYLTYLVLDVGNRLAAEESLVTRAQREQRLRSQEARFNDETGLAIKKETRRGSRSEGVLRYEAIFQGILDAWRAEAKNRGARFIIASEPRTPSVTGELLLGDSGWIDLRRQNLERGHEKPSWKFENDPHWNEFGNMLGAVDLFDEIVAAEGLSPIPRGDTMQALCSYYGSFPDGWMPVHCEGIAAPSEDIASRIRDRYLSLQTPSQAGAP